MQSRPCKKRAMHATGLWDRSDRDRGRGRSHEKTVIKRRTRVLEKRAARQEINHALLGQ